MSQELHRVRGRVDVALDVVGRAIVAHRPEPTSASDRVLEGLCLAAKELALVAEIIDEELAGRLVTAAG